MTSITPELIRAALAHIPASLPRDEWARVGMAIKSEFPDATGQDLFETWSATADGHDPRATRSTWRSIKAGGGVGIGTLLHLAKEHGFVLPKASEAPSAPSPEVLAQREREKAERQLAERANQQAAHAAAALEAAVQWDAASDTGTSPYLARKGVQVHGVRFASDGSVLVPLRDAAGDLWNLQRIAPERPADGIDKLFLKGGRKSGLWHWCGDPAGASVLLIAEGYATAASVHQATGRPVAVAFDAGNLAHVAKALRQRDRTALLVLCGDDDAATEARTGTNTGRVKAEAAARAVRGLAVFPAGLPDGGSDFNDMHQAQGLQAVGACVEAAIAAHLAEQAKRAQQAAQSSKVGKATARTPREPRGADGGHGGGNEPPHSDGRPFDPFTVNDSGVWHAGVDKEGQPKAPQWVCSRLDVQALTRDQDGAGWGYLLAFADPLGKPKQWAMPARMLSGDGGEYRAALLNMGLRIAPSPAARNLLTQYIQTRQPGEFASCTDRIGWHGRAFPGWCLRWPAPLRGRCCALQAWRAGGFTSGATAAQARPRRCALPPACTVGPATCSAGAPQTTRLKPSPRSTAIRC